MLAALLTSNTRARLFSRTGRCGREGQALTYFTYADLAYIRPIATVIAQSGFEVPEYTLKLSKVVR